MKNIAFFIHKIHLKAGMERVTSVIANALAHSDNINVHIISFYRPSKGENGFPLDKNIHVHYLDRKRTSYKDMKSVSQQLTALIAQYQITSLIIVDTLLMLFALFAKGKNLQKIAWEHFNFHAKNKPRLKRFVARHLCLFCCKNVLVLTKMDQRNYQKKSLPWQKKKVLYFPNPITIESVDIEVKREKVIVSIGRLEDQKGMDILVDMAVDFLKEKEDWQLKIFGEGTHKEKLLKQIEHNQMQGKIHLLPYSDNVGKELMSASIYTMCSRYEGMPLILLEAMSYALPIVVFDCPSGPRELVTNGENGFLIAMNDKKTFSEKVTALMNNTQMRDVMGARGSQISENFQLDKILVLWQDLLL